MVYSLFVMPRSVLILFMNIISIFVSIHSAVYISVKICMFMLNCQTKRPDFQNVGLLGSFQRIVQTEGLLGFYRSVSISKFCYLLTIWCYVLFVRVIYSLSDVYHFIPQRKWCQCCSDCALCSFALYGL